MINALCNKTHIESTRVVLVLLDLKLQMQPFRIKFCRGSREGASRIAVLHSACMR